MFTKALISASYIIAIIMIYVLFFNHEASAQQGNPSIGEPNWIFKSADTSLHTNIAKFFTPIKIAKELTREEIIQKNAKEFKANGGGTVTPRAINQICISVAKADSETAYTLRIAKLAAEYSDTNITIANISNTDF